MRSPLCTFSHDGPYRSQTMNGPHLGRSVLALFNRKSRYPQHSEVIHD
jgi:hypothetical protein